MANRRMIARNVATSKKLSSISDFAEIIWYRSQPFTDDFGRLTADPDVLRATVIPMGRKGKITTLSAISRALDELESVGLISRYSVNGDMFMEFINFGKFQTMKADRIPKAEYPDPTESNGIQRNPLEGSRAGAITKPNLTKPNLTTSSEPEPSDPAFSEGDDPYDLALDLRDYILDNNPSANVPDPTSPQFQKWALCFDRMIRLDNRRADDIGWVTKWCQTDDFWRANILSPDKLRKQYDQLYLKSRG